MAIDPGSIDHLSQVISQVVAPSFLLGAVSAFITMLHGRLVLVQDRIRALNAVSPDDPKKAGLRADLPRLKRRVQMLSLAIRLAMASGVATTVLIIAAFSAALLAFQHVMGTALLFILSLTLFCASLLVLYYDATIAISDHDHHAA